eukprot:GILJ01017556.1.p1 GENE.GILJ01017556.1~~GILJ01017556.1.p1  ORF type:complete len:261 (+),score=24.59 GILJ01017556.1:118-900(+)
MSDDDQVCQLQPGYIHDVVDFVFRGKSPIKKYAIIAYGATGSGKSFVVNTLIRHELHMTDAQRDAHCVNILVDDLVENITMFHQQPDKLYFPCRKEVDDLSNLILKRAVAEGLNVVYETTGRSVSWLIGDLRFFQRHGYEIVLAYPLVDYPILIDRLQRRNNQGSRTVDIQSIPQAIQLAKDNIKHVMPFIDTMLVYNNNNHDEPTVVIRVDNVVTHTNNSMLVTCAVSPDQDNYHRQWEDPVTLADIEHLCHLNYNNKK